MSYEDIYKREEPVSSTEKGNLTADAEKIENRKAKDAQDAKDNIKHWDATLQRIQESGNKIEDKTSTAYEVNQKLAQAAQDKIDFYKEEFRRLQ